MPTLAVLTLSFPFLPGEQFVEDEAHHWLHSRFDTIVVLPVSSSGTPRHVPSGVIVDTSLAQSCVKSKIVSTLSAFLSAKFWRELCYLRGEQKLSIARAVQALVVTAKIIMLQRKLERCIQKYGHISVAYCYWNHIQSYAACELKKLGYIEKVVSRVHRFDLYENESPNSYMPLKRQYVELFDKVFCLSEEGADYLVGTFGFSRAQTEIAPLGVPIPDALSMRSPKGTISIVSLSFCSPIKRIDRIVDAVCMFSKRRSDQSVVWTHIGAGSHLSQIKAYAYEKLSGIANVEYRFLGGVDNQAARSYFTTHPVDVFVNASQSEGMPVSIMEAMSAGVPAIAPNVGGISKLVSSSNGILLDPSPSAADVAQAIEDICFSERYHSLKCCARKTIEISFNAKDNYQKFMDSLNVL